MRIFLTHIVPKDRILKYNLSVAACNFSHNLIEGNGFDRVYSILPTFVNGDIENFDGLIYSKWRKYSFLKRCAWIPESLKAFQQIPRNSTIWYYNCTILNALLIVLLKIFKPSVKQYMIVLDYTPSSSLDSKVYLWLTNKMNGTIKLADNPLFKVENCACLPGVVPRETAVYPTVDALKKEFLISGALNDNIAMLPMLLEAFSKMPDMTLHITGRAPDENFVRQYSSKHKNIIYHGMVAYDEYLDILHSTPFLLSTRNPEMPENQCNFPSKIIEALLHNRIIVSTIHYPQLVGIDYFEVGSECKSFVDNLKFIFDKREQEILRYANQSEKVKASFSADVWMQRIQEIESAKK